LCAAAADVNLLKVPDGMEDSKVVLLSDIMPTGWHGAMLANVQKGDRVAIWGCGPGEQNPPKQSQLLKTLNVHGPRHRMNWRQGAAPSIIALPCYGAANPTHGPMV